MYQNPFFTRRKPEFRGDSPSMSPADMTRDEGMFQRRQRYMARKNPLIAKPIRYDDPKGGYQQPGARDGAGTSAAYPPGDIRNNQGPDTYQMSNHMSSLFDSAAASSAPKPMASFGSGANESTQERQAAFDSMQAQSAQTQSRRPNYSIRYSQRNPLMR